MPWFSVNATMSVAAWVTIEADTPEAAREKAAELGADMYDYDLGTAEIEFNVTPEVETA